MTNAKDRIHELFKELVPASGKADTVAGEIVRAVTRIQYRFFNDGDRIGVGYGNETCNPAARYLMDKGGDAVENSIARLWGEYWDDRYEAELDRLVEAAVAYIDKHPELCSTANDIDMWSYRNPAEDRDDEEDEDEDDADCDGYDDEEEDY